jgi:preprotein translocase subunit SecE
VTEEGSMFVMVLEMLVVFVVFVWHVLLHLLGISLAIV